MANKSPFLERREKEAKMKAKVDTEVGKLLRKYGKFSEKEIRHVVYKKWIHQTLQSGDCALLLGLYVKDDAEACRQIAEKINEVMSSYYSSKANYLSESKTAYSIQIADNYYRADSKKSCGMQKECIEAITPIVQESISHLVTDIKPVEGSKYGLKDGCKTGFNMEIFARTYGGPQVIVFSNNQDFAESTIRGALSKAVENIQNNQGSEENSAI